MRDGAVAFVPATRVLVVGGRDRVRFLHAVIAQDVQGLAPGQGAFSALTDDRGRPVASFHLYVLPEAILLEIPSGHADAVRAALERLVVADDVVTAWAAGETVAYEAGDPALLAATMEPVRAIGESAPGVGFVDIPLEDPGDDVDALAQVPLRRQAVLHASRVGGVGALHWAEGSRADELAAVAAWGDSRVRVLLSAEQRAPLEIEAGIAGDEELAEARVWNELDLMDAVSLTKGCWMGQEIVRRVHVLGEVKRRRMGVFIDTPHGQGWSGAALETPDGAAAGIVTRAARSATLGRTVAQAFVARSAWAPGSALVAVRPADGARVRAETASLPFVARAPRVEAS